MASRDAVGSPRRARNWPNITTSSGAHLSTVKPVCSGLWCTYFENGLSWAVVFNKREALDRAFADFDPAVVATMTDRDVDRMMRDDTIIRNRAKIEATVHNARLLTSLSLADIAWRYRPRPRHPLRQWSDGRAQSPESRQLANQLQREGFRFVGPVVAHSFMQSTGIENGHFDGCFRAPAA